MRPHPGRCPARQVKTAAEGRNPPSKTIGIRLPCRHLKIDDSAHAAAGVMQTFLSFIPLGEQEKRTRRSGRKRFPHHSKRALGHCTALGVSDSPEYISYRRREGCGSRSSPAKSRPGALRIDRHSDVVPTVAGLLWLHWSGTPRLSPNDRPSTTSKVKLFKLGGIGVTFHVNAAWKWPRRRLIPSPRTHRIHSLQNNYPEADAKTLSMSARWRVSWPRLALRCDRKPFAIRPSCLLNVSLRTTLT